MARAQKGDGKPGPRPFSRRPDDQDPGADRRFWHACCRIPCGRAVCVCETCVRAELKSRPGAKKDNVFMCLQEKHLLVCVRSVCVWVCVAWVCAELKNRLPQKKTFSYGYLITQLPQPFPGRYNDCAG